MLLCESMVNLAGNNIHLCKCYVIISSKHLLNQSEYTIFGCMYNVDAPLIDMLLCMYIMYTCVYMGRKPITRLAILYLFSTG
jgi:hypothetical protein